MHNTSELDSESIAIYGKRNRMITPSGAVTVSLSIYQPLSRVPSWINYVP